VAPGLIRGGDRSPPITPTTGAGRRCTNLCDIAETARQLKDSVRGLVYDVAAGTLREVG